MASTAPSDTSANDPPALLSRYLTLADRAASLEHTHAEHESAEASLRALRPHAAHARAYADLVGADAARAERAAAKPHPRVLEPARRAIRHVRRAPGREERAVRKAGEKARADGEASEIVGEVRAAARVAENSEEGAEEFESLEREIRDVVREICAIEGIGVEEREEVERLKKVRSELFVEGLRGDRVKVLLAKARGVLGVAGLRDAKKAAKVAGEYVVEAREIQPMLPIGEELRGRDVTSLHAAEMVRSAEVWNDGFVDEVRKKKDVVGRELKGAEKSLSSAEMEFIRQITNARK